MATSIENQIMEKLAKGLVGIIDIVVPARQEQNANYESLLQSIKSSGKTTQEEIRNLSSILTEGFSKIVGATNEMEEIKSQLAQLKGQLQEKDALLQEKDTKILSLEKEIEQKKLEEENAEKEQIGILDFLDSNIPDPAPLRAKPE
jgi:chromosome segregation ATPase